MALETLGNNALLMYPLNKKMAKFWNNYKSSQCPPQMNRWMNKPDKNNQQNTTYYKTIKKQKLNNTDTKT